MLRLLIVTLSFALAGGLICANDVLAVDPTDIVAYWSFDKGSGGKVPDDSGNGHEGNIVNAEWAEEGKVGGGMSFNGKGAFVDVPSKPDLDPGEDNWTIELWMKRADTAGGWQKILTKYEGNWIGYRVGLLDSSVHTIFGTGPAPSSVEFQTTTKIQDMDWHHIALVADKNGDAVIYIDGEPDVTTRSLTKIGSVITGKNVEIGRCWWCDGGNTLGFNGILDEIKIWRAALTQDEIALAMEGKLNVAVSPMGNLVKTWGMLKAR